MRARSSKARQRGVKQPLGRDVEQIELAGDQPRLDRGGLAGRQRGIQHRRLDASLDQARDLVAHQRNQRRDHDAAALAQQRRQLIAQRFAAAGRHQHQAIAAACDMPDDLFLRAAKAGQAEHGIEQRKRVGAERASVGGRRAWRKGYSSQALNATSRASARRRRCAAPGSPRAALPRQQRAAIPSVRTKRAGDPE